MVGVDDSAETRAWPAGWYADPWYSGQQRYWDGAAWTPHVQPAAPATPAAEAPAWGDDATAGVSMRGADATAGASAWGDHAKAAASARGDDPTAEAPAWGAAAATDAPAWGAGPTTGQASSTAGWGASTPGWGAGSGDPYAPPWAAPGGGDGWLRPPPDTAPPRRPARWVALGVIAVVVAVAAAAITVASGAGRPKHVAARVPIANGGGAAGPSTTIPPAASSDPNAGLLNRIDVTQADAPAGDIVTLLQGGNLVSDQVTLDLCNGTYPSESLRTARRQLDLDDRTGRTLLSTEAVLYTSPSATAQAFSELKARGANCPQTFIPPPPGEDALPASKTTFSAPPDGSWPAVAGVERLAYAFTTSTQDGTSDDSIAVYLRHGRALLGLYFSNPGQFAGPIAGKTTVEGVVGVFEQRLAQLPASAVNATVPALPPAGGI